MAAVLKTAMARKRHRGFESHALRSAGGPCRGRAAEAARHGDLQRVGDKPPLVAVAPPTTVGELEGEATTDEDAEDRGRVRAGRLDGQQPRLPARLRDRDPV